MIDFDCDGALQESAARLTRRTALSAGALLTLGGTGFGALVAEDSFAMVRPSRRRDRDILNFALNLEYLEADFYNAGLKQAGLTGPLLTLARTTRDHEEAHVRFLVKTLGAGRYIKRPKFDFRNTVTDAAQFHRTAVKLEDTGVRAYSGQAPIVKSPTVLAAAASILTVEARHAAAFRLLLGLDPAPHGFDSPATKGEIDADAKRLKFGYRPVTFRSD